MTKKHFIALADVARLEILPRSLPRHEALSAARCNHCGEAGLLLSLATTITHEGGLVAACDSCAEAYHGVSFGCFGRLAAAMRQS